MTSWLENQKCILMKENTRRRRFRLRKNNEADILISDPIQSMDESNPCPLTQANRRQRPFDLRLLLQKVMLRSRDV